MREILLTSAFIMINNLGLQERHPDPSRRKRTWMSGRSCAKERVCMHNQLIQFEGSDVLVAIQGTGELVQPTGFLDDTITGLDKRLDQALAIVTSLGNCFYKVFEDSKTETAEVELNLQCTAKGTVYVVEGSGNASFKVKLAFKKN